MLPVGWLSPLSKLDFAGRCQLFVYIFEKFDSCLFTFCRRCLVQGSYAIGVAEPLSITVFDYGTSNKSSAELTEIVRKNFDLRPGKIVK